MLCLDAGRRLSQISSPSGSFCLDFSNLYGGPTPIHQRLDAETKHTPSMNNLLLNNNRQSGNSAR